MAFAAARIIREKQENKKKLSEASNLIPTSRKESQRAVSSMSSLTSPAMPPLSYTGKGEKTGQSSEQSNSTRKQSQVRRPVKCVKRIKGKKGKPDTFDLIVQIDRSKFPLSIEKLEDCKEVFMLFDRDCDGVLSFTECVTALHTMGYRISEKKVLELVRAVSEDDVYFSIEFNEFLKMISRKESEHLQLDCLVEAFRTFDLKNAGFVRSERVVKVLEGKMSRRDIEQMMALADTRNDGRIDYQAFCSLLCEDQIHPEAMVRQIPRERKTSEFYPDCDEKIWEELEQELGNSVKTLNKG